MNRILEKDFGRLVEAVSQRLKDANLAEAQGRSTEGGHLFGR
jgi:hypothetical protein